MELRPEDGETITDRPERDVRVLLAHELLDVTWSRYAPGERGPEPHIHHRHADSFYVLAGEVAFGLGPGAAERIAAGPGTLVVAPIGVVHTFANESGADAWFLNIHAPSEGFVASLRARRDGDENAERLFDIDDP